MKSHQKARIPIGLLAILGAVFVFASPASAEWQEKVLYSFQGLPNDGAYPAGGVVFDKAGNLYGATSLGGADNCPGITQCGIVYQLKPPTEKDKPWAETVLYVFKGVNSNDGNTPEGGVLLDSAGNVYGTTAYGGTGKCRLFGGRVGCGTVVELIPPKHGGGKWTEKVLYSFQSGKDGYFPWGDLTFDNAGNLYGATQYGGGYGTCNAPYYQYCGTVFELSPPKRKGDKWTEKVLYAFESGTDGANPNGGLVFDKAAIYGTTLTGGNQRCKYNNYGIGCGIVFMLMPPSSQGALWSEKLLHRFADGADGASPNSGLTRGAHGVLYGTTGAGGVEKDGVVFRLTMQKDGTWAEGVMHAFTDNAHGRGPSGPVTLDSAGDLYGPAGWGRYFGGVVFHLVQKTGGWSYSLPYEFKGTPDGSSPAAGLIFDTTGNLYGTTQGGGTGQTCQSGCGTVFEISP